MKIHQPSQRRSPTSNPENPGTLLGAGISIKLPSRHLARHTVNTLDDSIKITNEQELTQQKHKYS